MNTEGQDCGADGGANCELSVADRWIISRLQQTEAEVNQHVEGYRFDLAAQALYEFIWNEYCDWYLELSKPVLTHLRRSSRPCAGTRRTLVRVLETHPAAGTPLHALHHRGDLAARGAAGRRAGRHRHAAALPGSGRQQADDRKPRATSTGSSASSWGYAGFAARWTSSPNRPLPCCCSKPAIEDRRRLEDYRLFLERLARTGIDHPPGDADEAPESAIALVGDMQVLVPMAGLIDKDAELKRLAKERDRGQGRPGAGREETGQSQLRGKGPGGRGGTGTPACRRVPLGAGTP
jgi:valyl-tRNA synthetase